SARSAQVVDPPAKMRTAVVMLGTSAGAWTVVPSVPLPSCPYWLRPQHVTVPALRRAHACDSPIATSTAPITPGTRAGTECARLSVAPVPRMPLPFEPQHETPPSPWIAQDARERLTAIPTASLIPVTCTGSA